MMEIRTVSVRGAELRYFSFGEGTRPFLIVPGMSLHSVMPSADAIAEGYAAFGEHYRVYVFDRRTPLPQGFGVDDMAKDLAEAMIALGLGEADVFGASQGGMIVQSLAILYPELVRRAVVCSTQPRMNAFAAATLEAWKRYALAGDVAKLNRSFASHVYAPAFYEAFRSVFEAMETEGTPEELADFVVSCDATATFDVYGRLDRIRCPFLVLGAERDGVISSLGSREIAEKLSCECILYPDFGHAVYDENPSIRQTILSFLLS